MERLITPENVMEFKKIFDESGLESQKNYFINGTLIFTTYKHRQNTISIHDDVSEVSFSHVDFNKCYEMFSSIFEMQYRERIKETQ